MSISDIKSELPGYAKDLKLNLTTVLDPQGLDKEQVWGCIAACAIASRNDELQHALLEEAAENLSGEAFEAAKGAAAIMSMNNIYYRFLHMVSDDEYAQMPARLRMKIIGNPGVDKVNFELWCLAVSAINGCQNCIASHEKVVTNGGISKQGVQGAVKIAALLHAIAVVFDAENS